MKSRKLTTLLESANKAYTKLLKKTTHLQDNQTIIESLFQIKNSLDEINKISTEFDEESDNQLKQFVCLENNEAKYIYDSQSEIKDKIKLDSRDEALDQNLQLAGDTKQRFSRGPYRQYTQEVKENVIQLFRQGNTFNRIAKTLGIPSKNVIRWCKNGAHRKPGAGRKVLDPEMEEKLYNWIKDTYEMGSLLQIQKVRRKAKQFSTVPGFFASLGWLKNFSKRYSLKQKYNIH